MGNQVKSTRATHEKLAYPRATLEPEPDEDGGTAAAITAAKAARNKGKHRAEVVAVRENRHRLGSARRRSGSSRYGESHDADGWEDLPDDEVEALPKLKKPVFFFFSLAWLLRRFTFGGGAEKKPPRKPPCD